MNGQPGSITTRRTPRRTFEHPMGILRHGSYDVMQAVQLSEGGMLFRSEEQFQTKEQIVVTLLMPGGGSVVTRGEIIYGGPASSGGYQFGVRFPSLAVSERRLIRSYVAAKTEAEAEREHQETLLNQKHSRLA